MPEKIVIEHSTRTDAAYNDEAVVYVIDPDKVKLRKMEPARFTGDPLETIAFRRQLAQIDTYAQRFPLLDLVRKTQ